MEVVVGGTGVVVVVGGTGVVVVVGGTGVVMVVGGTGVVVDGNGEAVVAAKAVVEVDEVQDNAAEVVDDAEALVATDPAPTIALAWLSLRRGTVALPSNICVSCLDENRHPPATAPNGFNSISTQRA